MGRVVIPQDLSGCQGSSMTTQLQWLHVGQSEDPLPSWSRILVGWSRSSARQNCARTVGGGGGGGKSEIDGTAEQLKAALAAQVATVKSPSKLEQEQTFLIAKKLQELTGSKNIKLKPVIDESLIAGFVVEYGSSQIDLSVKGQLDKISQELENASFAF